MTSMTRTAIALAAVSTLALAACGGGGNDPADPGDDIDFGAAPSGTLRTMGFNPSDEVGQSRAELAAEALGDVSIEMDTASFDPQKFAALAAAGDLPDVVQMERSSVATFAEKDLIMPLDDCFQAQGVPEDYWYPAVVEEASWDDDVYAAPQFFQPALVIVNNRVAEAAGVDPATVDTSDREGLLAAAEAMTTMDGAQPTVLGFDPDMPGSTTTWIEVFGGSVMDDDGRPTIDDPANVEAVTFLNELMEVQGGYTEVTSFKQTWDVFGEANQYVTDQVGAGTWGQWYINVLAGSKDDVDLSGVPIRDLDGKVFGLAGGSALVIPAGAKNPVAACEWITTVTSLEAWEAAGDARAATATKNDAFNTGLFTGSPSADQAVRDAHVVPTGNAGFDQLIEVSYEALTDVRTVGTSPVGQQINDALKNAVGVALAGEKPVADALAEAQATAMKEWEGLD